MNKFLIAASAALLLATPIAAIAQDVPVYAPAPDQVAQDVPSYAQAPSQDEQVRGRIVSFDGAYSLEVRDERGFTDRVELHQGTILNPTGITLEPGMTVSILGYNQGDFLAANEVDTPYSIEGGNYYYGGHPWDYYGPTISLGFFFGDLGWWHGDYFHGPFEYRGGARYYNNVNITNIYRNSTTYNSRRYNNTYNNPGTVGNRQPRTENPRVDQPRTTENPGVTPGDRIPRPETQREDGPRSYQSTGVTPADRAPRADFPRTTTQGPTYRNTTPRTVTTGTFHGHQFVAPREGGGYYRSAPASHGGGSHAEGRPSGGGEHRTH
jgi:hypothetical protein